MLKSIDSIRNPEISISDVIIFLKWEWLNIEIIDNFWEAIIITFGKKITIEELVFLYKQILAGTPVCLINLQNRILSEIEWTLNQPLEKIIELSSRLWWREIDQQTIDISKRLYDKILSLRKNLVDIKLLNDWRIIF